MSATYPLPDGWEDPGDLVSRVRSHERVVLTDHGTPVAALVPLQDLDELEAIDLADIALADAILARGEEPIPHEQVEAMLDALDEREGEREGDGAQSA